MQTLISAAGGSSRTGDDGASRARQIVLIGQPESFNRALLTECESSGFHLRYASDIREALDEELGPPAGLFAIAPLMFRAHGIQFATQIGSHTSTPFVVLTEEPDDVDCVLALGLGASDYISTTDSSRVVIARLQAILRRAAPPSATENRKNASRAGKFILDEWARSITYDGNPVFVTGGEYDLFSTLFKHFGQIVKREALLTALRQPVTEAASQTLDTRIYRLRRRCELAGAPEHVIKCVRNSGYILVDR